MSAHEPIAVLGAGTMGHGIAQIAATSGYVVHLFDSDTSRLAPALDRIRDHLIRSVGRGAISTEASSRALENLRLTPELRIAVTTARLIIEAVPERMELKAEVFREVDRLAPEPAILASNTSSLSITDLASATQRPDRVVGLHFFNPPHRMRLLEVVRGEQTSRPTVEWALDFARTLGKEPILVSDTPGFASSRLGVVLGLEAMRMLEQGVASAEDIDRAMELGYNHPMGPLRLTDLVGLDVRLGIAEYLHERLGEEQYRPPDILRRLVAEGRLGRKSGQGFYQWEERE